MKRLLADTNFYGRLAIDKDRFKIIETIKTNNKLIIYGFKIVRAELRDTPKSIKIGKIGFRIDLLNLYDTIVEEHVIDISDSILKISENYHKSYREFGGIRSKEEILQDFLIVAAASFNNIDVLVSNDEKTMLNENAIRAYNLINSVLNKRTPKFINYEDFKKSLRGDSNELL